jgi:hypothetical protein
MNDLQIYDTLEQGSDEWLQARCGILTASVIGKLITPTLKVADNDTSRGVALTLAAERITGRVEYVHPTFDMQRGTEDEPVARDAYAAAYGPVNEVGFILKTTDAFQLGYSPDGLVGETGLIEIKSRKPKEHLRTIVNGKPPTENLAQLFTGLFVTGRDWIDYVSYSPGLPLWGHRVYPDTAWFDAIEAAATELESTISQIRRRYNAETDGLPMTEPRIEVEDLIF